MHAKQFRWFQLPIGTYAYKPIYKDIHTYVCIGITN